MGYRVNVGGGADLPGASDSAIQAAIELVAARGGGVVQLAAGLYELTNSVRLRSGVHLCGSGPETVLRKCPSATVAIVEDTDWYERRVTVADVAPFRVGGGVTLQSTCPHYGCPQISIHTILAIEGHTLHLDNMARGLGDPPHYGNFWVGYNPTASTVFSPVTANWATEFGVSDLTIDGNRGESDCLNGNYCAALYFQDCSRVTVERVKAGNIRSDGISFQVVHDLAVRDCLFEDCVQGIHPGSGSQRPVIQRNTVRRAEVGLFWCWGVKHGLAEGNTFEECRLGMSIGHRDTHNTMRGNTMLRCSEAGLLFRVDPRHQAADHNLVEGNRFEDCGSADGPGVGIDIAGPVTGIDLRDNRFAESEFGVMPTGIRICAEAGEVRMDGNGATDGIQLVDDRRIQ